MRVSFRAAATLAVSTLEVASGNAQLMFDMGCHAVEDLSNYFGLQHTHEIGAERDEFVTACVALAGADYHVARTEDAWERFQAMRTRYAGPLNALARNFVIPPAQWIGDRSTLHPFDGN